MVEGVRPMPIIVDASYKKGSCLDWKKINGRGIREIMKMKINVDERLSSDITWAQKKIKDY